MTRRDMQHHPLQIAPPPQSTVSTTTETRSIPYPPMSSPASVSRHSDNHVLIAFAAEAIGHIAAETSHTRSPTSVARHGIRGSDSETTKKTLAVSDAIAALCIFQDGEQAVAVALQMDAPSKTIRLIIAENRPERVEPRVVEHIGRVWCMLQELSGYHAKLRSPIGEERSQDWPLNQESPEPPIDKFIRTAKVNFVELVYTFSWKKIQKRIEKCLPQMNYFVNKIWELPCMKSGVGEGGDPIPEAIFNAAHIHFQAFVTLTEGRRPNTLSNTEWGKLTNSMDMFVVKVLQVLKFWGKCEEWDRLFGGINDRPIRRTLEKMTALHRHITKLINFANSPRRRAALKYQMAIVTVTPPQPRQVQLPPSVEAWKDVMSNLCVEEGVMIDDNFLDREAAALAARYSKETCIYSCITHCECSLIAYLEKNHDTDHNYIPAFSYIGVSKLSCRACSLWIDWFNKRGGRQYHTRGCHGKWYWPWGAPPGLDFDEATTALNRRVQDDYVRLLKATGRLRAASDSSGASGVSEPRIDPETVKELDDYEEELVNARRAAMG